MENGSGLGEKRKTEGPAQFGQGDAFVGRGDGAAHARLDQAALDADEVGGEQRAFLETGAAERGAFLGLFDGTGR